jgi:DNA-binding NarL/FixJ family response regulator
MAEGELHQRAVSSGADGYISKRDGFRKVMEQIERVLSGEQVSKWKMKA